MTVSGSLVYTNNILIFTLKKVWFFTQRSLRKTDGHQTTPLKKEPLQIVKIDKNTRKKKINDCETSGREQVMKNTSKTNKKGGIENIDKTKKKYSAVFQGNEFDFENDKEDAEESIERLRKDVAMTCRYYCELTH